MIRWIDLAYGVAAIFYLPVVGYQMIVQGKNRRGWANRFGHVALPSPSRPRIWLHAVSLGEVNATRTLIARLIKALPHYEIVVSTTTDTGYDRACALYGPERVFRFPLDFSWMARRVLDRIRADLIVLMELEVWPNLIEFAAQRGVPVAVANGRLTAHSARRFAWLAPIARKMFSRLAWVGAQDEEIAYRFIGLGVPRNRVTVCGSLKWDTAEVTDAVDGADALAESLGIGENERLWVCGSTGPGEETIILDAYQRLRTDGRLIRLAIVPRKPERFDEVERLITRRSLNCMRRSRIVDTVRRRAPADGGEVILGDTMGELRKFYSLASVVFVGRSLVPLGGSDPMEVAALGRPMVVGPHTDNFAAPMEALLSESACVRVSSVAELTRAVLELLTDRERARAMGLRGQELARRHQRSEERRVGKECRSRWSPYH